MKDDKFTQALQDEMSQISFSRDKKERLAAQLKHAMHAGENAGAGAETMSRDGDRAVAKAGADAGTRDGIRAGSGTITTTAASITPATQSSLHTASKPRKQSVAATWQRQLAGSIAEFWNGTSEIPLPTAAAALILIGLGVWSQLSPLLLVDQKAAELLIQAGTRAENAAPISQGVSLL